MGPCSSAEKSEIIRTLPEIPAIACLLTPLRSPISSGNHESDFMNRPDSDRPDHPTPNVSGDQTIDLGETRPLDSQGNPLPKSAGSDPRAWIGKRLGKYEITALLGMGGMGVVLRAHDASIERDVAIKVLPPEISADSAALGRFLAEAKSAGKLNHPHTVTIHEIGQEGDTHFLVMEIVGGGSAAERIENGKSLPVLEATRVIIQASLGLSAAHAQGLIHRDIKPANLLLTSEGAVKIADFGLAKRANASTMQLTQTGQVLGTPYFMSPEQCEGKPVDHRSDVYSLGATYYSLLTGKNPYEDSGSVVQVMYAHCHAERLDPREVQSNVPSACAQIVQRAMARDPEDRYPSMDEMRVDLEAVLAGLSGVNIALPSQSSGNLPTLSSLPSPATSAKTPTLAKRFAIPVALVSLVLLAVGSIFLSALSGNRLPGENDRAESLGTGSPESGAASGILPPSGDPIRIGILHSLSGTMANSESSVADAALLAVDRINREGGVLGRPVEPVIADGRSRADVFAREARRLIEEEGVCTIFGCWTSESRKTVVPVVEELGHLLVYPVQYEGIEESPNVFYTGAAPNQQIIPAVRWAFDELEKRRFFLVGSDYVFPRIAHEIIKDQLNELGAEMVGEQFLPLGSTDVQDMIEAIQAAGPDVLLNSINGDSNTAFFSALRRAGITPDDIPTISFSIGEEDIRHLDLATMEHDYAAWNYFQSIDSPENEQFIATFRERFGPQRVVTDPMEAAYFGVLLWAQAVEDAESIEVPAIRRSMRNQRLRAPGGEVRIDATTQHTFKTPRIGQIREDGQFDIVWTSFETVEPQPYPPSRTAEQWRALLHDLHTGWGNRWSAPLP
jgi:urea transport system substrate-binding protein